MKISYSPLQFGFVDVAAVAVATRFHVIVVDAFVVAWSVCGHFAIVG